MTGLMCNDRRGVAGRTGVAEVPVLLFAQFGQGAVVGAAGCGFGTAGSGAVGPGHGESLALANLVAWRFLKWRNMPG